MKRVWIVIDVFEEVPKIKGVFTSQRKAEEVAYKNPETWCSVVAMELDKEV